ncbi:hypothetical protein [Comamonas denitrificans]|uniref:hypothetical protein n=1 Tax=Comamonas denitrificans TaxID=117506 RepID=UPI003607C112
MKNILLMGLTDHEAAAVEIMIGMNWRDHRCITLKRELSLAIPEQHAAARSCEACVLDLFGLGMRKYSPANATRLMEVMAGRPAVLLTWGDGGGWLEAKLPLAKGQHIGWVGVPYTSAGLRDAIKKVKEAAERMVPPAAAAVATAPAAMPAWRRAMELADQLKRKAAPMRARASAPMPLPKAQASSVSLAPPATRMATDAVGLGKGALAALLQVFPLLRDQPLIGLTEKIIGHDGPMLLRIGTDAAFVTHTRAGWLASGLPVSALLKLLRTPRLVESVRAEPLDPDHVEETVRQRFNGKFHRAQKPLDVITWELVSDVMRDMKLQRQGDLTFQLRRFPNFPMLAGVGPLDVQLAAICARMPQSISELLRAFPKHEQDVLRFVVLCVVSGLAKVIPGGPVAAGAVASPRAAQAPVAAAARKPEVAARRGFFKSLMDKLF